MITPVPSSLGALRLFLAHDSTIWVAAADGRGAQLQEAQAQQGGLVLEPWTPLSFQTGFSGSANVRALKSLGDPAVQMIQFRGTFSADAPWGGTPAVFAMLPPEIRPTSNHYLIFPSSSSSSPDSISSMMVSQNGQLIVHLTSTPLNPPIRGWVDGLIAA